MIHKASIANPMKRHHLLFQKSTSMPNQTATTDSRKQARYNVEFTGFKKLNMNTTNAPSVREIKRRRLDCFISFTIA